MKFAQVCIVLVLTVFGVAQCQNFMKFFSECTASSGAEMPDLMKLQAGQFVDNEKVKKFVGCLMRKGGLQDNSGKMLVKQFRSKLSALPKEDLEKIVKNCATKKGANMDESAFLMLKCSYETNPNIMKLAA